MAEQPAVNRQVLGSNPSQGAFHTQANTGHLFYVRITLRKFSGNLVTSARLNL